MKWLIKTSRSIGIWVLAIAIVVGLYTLPVFADSTSNPTAQTTTTSSNATSCKPDPNSDQPWLDCNPDAQTERDKANIPEKLIADMVGGFQYALYKAGIIPLNDLVFANDTASVQVFASNGSSSEFDKMMPIYRLIATLSWVFLVAVVMVNGLKIAKSGGNPRMRSSIGDMGINVLVGIMLMSFSWIIVSYMTDWSALLCKSLYDKSFSDLAVKSTGDYFATEVIQFILTCMSIFINVLYLLRKFLLMGMVLISPLVGLSYAAGNKQPFSIWLNEVINNAFMPFSHALVFAMYYYIVEWNGANKQVDALMGKWFAPFVMIFFLLPVSAFFRRVFSSLIGQTMGMNTESVAGGAMLGAVTGLSGAANLAGSLIPGRGKGGNLNGLKKAGNLAASAGSNGSGGPTGGGGGALGGNSVQGAVAASGIQSPTGSVDTGIGQVSPVSAMGASGAPIGGDSSGSGTGLGSLSQTSASGSKPFQTPKGIEKMQNRAGSGASLGRTIGGKVGSAALGAVGLGMDLGMGAATGRRTDFQGALSKAGSVVGQVPAHMIGGAIGGYRGRNQAIRDVRQQARQQGTPISRKEAFKRVMGFSQPDVNQNQRGQHERASRRMYYGSVAGSIGGERVSRFGGNLVSAGTRKGLESISNVKKR